MKNIKRILLLFLAFFGINAALKASNDGIENAMRGNAKFNVVAIVLGIIFAGLAFFMFRLDKRISNLEKDKDKKP